MLRCGCRRQPAALRRSLRLPATADSARSSAGPRRCVRVADARPVAAPSSRAWPAQLTTVLVFRVPSKSGCFLTAGNVYNERAAVFTKQSRLQRQPIASPVEISALVSMLCSANCGLMLSEFLSAARAGGGEGGGAAAESGRPGDAGRRAALPLQPVLGPGYHPAAHGGPIPAALDRDRHLQPARPQER